MTATYRTLHYYNQTKVLLYSENECVFCINDMLASIQCMYLVQVYFSMMKDPSIFLSTHTFVCIVYSRLLVYHHHKNIINLKNQEYLAIFQLITCQKRQTKDEWLVHLFALFQKNNPKCTINVQSVRCKVVFLLQCTLYYGGCWSGTLEDLHRGK